MQLNRNLQKIRTGGISYIMYAIYTFYYRVEIKNKFAECFNNYTISLSVSISSFSEVAVKSAAAI